MLLTIIFSPPFKPLFTTTPSLIKSPTTTGVGFAILSSPTTITTVACAVFKIAFSGTTKISPKSRFETSICPKFPTINSLFGFSIFALTKVYQYLYQLQEQQNQ